MKSLRNFLDRQEKLFEKGGKLEKYYYRSLVNLIMTKWNVPEFVVQPYYGTGAVIGGCVGNYLWAFAIPAQIFPLYDPVAFRDHIKQFLKTDITRHFLFEPMSGDGGGPWYPVNQDKIIEAIYLFCRPNKEFTI